MPESIESFLSPEHQALKPFFEPKTIAVIGEIENTGKTLLENLYHNPSNRQIYSINPDRPDIPPALDLAIIATPAREVPDILRHCVERNVKGAMILSTGFDAAGEEEIRSISRGKLRILGPACTGIINPRVGLNATLAPIQPKAGNLGFISQSGAIASAVLDWSLTENVGFSSFISLGSPLDIDWSDLLYYLGDDPLTKSIVIYVESIGNARSFLSAAREVSINKPIVAIRRRTSESATVALSHSGRLVGSELALEAAFNRCGIVEVQRIADLFNITEVLAKQQRLPRGKRLSVISNGAGPAVLATDALILTGGELARFAPETIEKLASFCPPNNPIDLRRSATIEDYTLAFEIALADPNTDGVLVIFTPRGSIDPAETARAIAPIAKNARKTVLASWMGGDGISEGETILNAHRIATYRYPDSAAVLFNRMWRYQYNLRGLYETPVLPVAESDRQRSRVTEMIDNIRGQNRTILTEAESNHLLAAYGIPVIPTKIARNEEEAVTLANSIDYPVAIKLLSSTILHKTTAGGVRLNITDPEKVRRAFRSIRETVDASDFLGVTVQPMIPLDSGYELFLGCSPDPRFGPILVFGTGGKLVEILGDRVVALPPLNTTLARRFMEGTKIYRAFQNHELNIDNLEQIIVTFSQLVIEQPWIESIDINPLFVNSEGAIVLSSSIVLHANDTEFDRLSHPAIRPYPSQYIGEWTTKKGLPVTIRPIRAEDEPLVRKFHEHLSEESIYFRYFHLVNLNRQTAYDRLTRECFIDYDRVMALIVESGDREMLGLGRLNKLHGVNEAEFDLLVSDAYQGHGLGTELLRRLVRIGREEGLERISAEILRENRSMQKVAEKVGFSLHRTGDSVKAELEL
ncbi:bifunctional acetate--CoA ligase family protein/GNAT family N-acetyltransferase [Pannus brasiliensis CCIBt3594]|uniref:Bifunctional acetate--CoA ligase family protein/GNAT family N-acetyltransferase n=1 Tax=Pannus brasiliensis CCIBt3594 TaxID=1427578 RepID=A0AAW9QSW1_9CHRO